MKNLMMITVAASCLFAGAASSFGQGILFNTIAGQTPVIFANNPEGLNVNDTIYQAYAGQKVFGPASTFEYALYLGPAGSTSVSQLTLVDTWLSANAPSTASPAAGAIEGGTITGTGNANPGFQIIAGTTYADQVWGWTTASGGSLQDAVDGDGIYGYSTIGSITPAAYPDAPPQIFGTGAGQLEGFGLGAPGVIPEPGTIALGGLGAAALLFFRRRK